jgi:hypothetical protein
VAQELGLSLSEVSMALERAKRARLLVDKTFLLSLEGHLGSGPGVRERRPLS